MIVATNGSILYRANRLRFILAAAFLLPMTVGIAALAYDAVVLGDAEVRGRWLLLPFGLLYIWFDLMVAAKLIWPPELEISVSGIRWSNHAMLQPNAAYSWQQVDGPEEAAGSGGVPLLRFCVKGSGRKLDLPPSHFGASYDEMAAAIQSARAGRLISPEEWRSEHPQHRLKHWLMEWGLPLAGGVVLALLIHRH